MELKSNELDLDTLNEENKKNKENKKSKENSEEDIYFYIMTLQADGQRHQIKIFENSNASELAFNFCKTYNLDFQTMKYLKKAIKQILLHFNNTRKNEMIYLLKENSSIQEVAEEEIITDNSLKKSGTYKKNNSNNKNKISEENPKIKKNISKESLISDKKVNNNNSFKKYLYNINEDKDKEKNGLKEIKNEKKVIEEEDGKIALKDYSIDYCLENESVEVFPPTEHTTKIEQKSSIKNSYSLNQKKNCDLNDKKKNSKNKKLQINNNTINYNRINKKQNCLFNLNKAKKDKNKNNDINNSDLKSILNQHKDIKSKEKSRSITKSKSRSKSKSKEKRYEIEKENHFIKRNNYSKNNQKPKSLEKMKKKAGNKISFIDNKKPEITRQNNNNHRIYKHEKYFTNMNEIKNKYFSNYNDYFIKTKNFNTFIKNGIGHKYQTSNSINQDSYRSKSKSISQHKIKKNLTQRTTLRNNTKKEKSMAHLNIINHQKINYINNNSKLNLNMILKKDSFAKEKQRTVFKNKIKSKYNIIYNKNNTIFNKTINGQCLSSRNKLKDLNGKELFMESKKSNKTGIKKMVTESLLNIHKIKDLLKEKKKNNCIKGRIKNSIKINNKSRNNKNNNIYFKNENYTDKNKNLQEKIYYESGINNVNNVNSNNVNINMKNKRNITDVNLIYKANIRNEYKKNI